MSDSFGSIYRPGFLRAIMCAFIWAAMSLVAAGAKPARVGILVSEGQLQNAGDLLTAELSKNVDVALVERAELNRITKEQALRTNATAVGLLLGADALIFLELTPAASTTNGADTA